MNQEIVLPQHSGKPFAEDMADRKAFEEKHNAKIIRIYTKVPPQEFQDIVVKEANTYYVLNNARFVGNVLVAERFGGHNQSSESLMSMLDGLERGYKLALGPCKPYYITYTEVQYARKFAKLYAGKTEREVFDAEGLDYYSDKLPEYLFKKKVVVEYYARCEDADARTWQLRGQDRVTPLFPQHESVNHWRVQHDNDRSCHF